MTTSQTPSAPPASPVTARLDHLRRLADDDPAGACQWAWAWFHELGAKVATRRRAALTELNELFRQGTPPGDDLDGATEGILVTTTVSPAAERGTRAIAGAWMPWLGKRFERAQAVGYNRLETGARLPSKLLWPRYAMWGPTGPTPLRSPLARDAAKAAGLWELSEQLTDTKFPL